MAREILFYSAEGCPDCRRARQFLDEHAIPYRVIDIAEDPAAARLLEESTGKRGIPYLVVDGKWIRAYTPGGGPLPAEEILAAVGEE